MLPSSVNAGIDHKETEIYTSIQSAKAACIKGMTGLVFNKSIF